jgi:hypothetical protein
MLDHIKRFAWIFDIGFRCMNREQMPGWGPHMLVFSILGLALFAWCEFGIAIAWGLLLVAILDFAATQYFVRRSLRQVGRLGAFGLTRARWWIEVAALCWTLCFSLGLFSLAQGAPGGGVQLRALQLADIAAECAGYLYFAFFVLTVVSFVLGLAQRKPIHGRSLELVAWFFWCIVFIYAVIWVTPDNPVLTDIVAPICAVLGIVALVAAGLMAVWLRNVGNAPSRH